MTTRWKLRPVEDAAAVERLAGALNDVPYALARALVLRGITSFDAARDFFRPDLHRLHDPFEMSGMDRAADRLAQAVDRGEKVLVYGDYDVDGTTATALMTAFLRRLGLDATYFIPNRFEHGYGLGTAGLDAAKDAGATVVVALDCGITAHEPARYAKSLGLDLIICDHHKPEAETPEAYAVLDAKQACCGYPFKELSGCGVGFKLAQATLARLGRDVSEANEFLDLVAVSTAADIVPLYGENRELMAAGLERLRTQPRPGLAALADVVGLDLAGVTTESIVFALGPRINAAGRLGDARTAVELLLTPSPTEAARLAADLEAYNAQRRTLDQQIQDEAGRMAEDQLAKWAEHTVVLYNRDWHLGVIGIVASRLVERFYRPAIMMCSPGGGLVKGSARSIGGISVHAALTECADLLDAYGGHDFAAGLTLREENVPEFQRRFDAAVGRATVAAYVGRSFDVDAELSLDDVTGRFWAILRQFAPHGPDNHTPTWQSNDLEVVGPPQQVGRERQHLKFYVRQRGGARVFEVIGYRLGAQIQDVATSARTGQPLELVHTIEENVYRGQRSLQLKAKDVRLAATGGDGAA
ncbi:MAG TPA: single-stranded-DNA-specific exonuclease RecJ [Rhodothermales bacterium]|nr:single-stranded-DNA-specific exonuclease RecJ [Rhodothermales bacterium]